jgi:hypothetical protein
VATKDDKRRRRERDRRRYQVKPDACEECGLLTAKLERHHEDYSGDERVRFLCRECHAQTHMFRMVVDPGFDPVRFCNLFKGTEAAEFVRHGAHTVDLMLEFDPYSWPPPL